jgi:hypothetical protein
LLSAGQVLRSPIAMMQHAAPAPAQVLNVVEPEMQKLLAQGVKLGPANVPAGYRVRSGAQLE